MSNVFIKKLTDVYGNQMYPQTSVEALVSTTGGGGKFLVTNATGGVFEGDYNILQQKYPMKSVDYYRSSIETTIGTPFTGALDGDSLLPTIDTLGCLYIMPNSNSNPTGCVSFATIQTGINEYKWVNLGPVDVPNNVLTEADVDDICVDGLATDVASANVVSTLKYKLYGEGGTVRIVEIVSNPQPSGKNLCNSKWAICRNGTSRITDTTQNAVHYRSGEINVSYRLDVEKYRGGTIYVKSHSDYNIYYMLVKKGLGADYPTLANITLQQLIDADTLCSVHNVDGTWYNCLYLSYDPSNFKTIEIPNDAKYIYIAGRMYDLSLTPPNFEGAAGRWDRRIPSRMEIEYQVKDADGDISNIKLAVDALDDKMSEEEETTSELYDEIYGTPVAIEEDGYDYSGTELVRGISIDPNKLYTQVSASKYAAYIINVEGKSSIKIAPQATRSTYMMVTKSLVPKKSTPYSSSEMWNNYIDKNCYILNGLQSTSDPNNYRICILPEDSSYTPSSGFIFEGETELQLTDDSKYVYIQKYFSGVYEGQGYAPDEITIYGTENKGGLVDLRNEINNDTNVSSGSLIDFVQGYFEENGAFTESLAYVTTGFIPMNRGCLIKLFDDYRIYQAYLFDSNGNMVNPREMYANNQVWANCFSYPQLASARPQFYIRLKIGTSSGDDGIAKVDDRIIKEFAWLDNPRLKRKLPTNAEMQAWATQFNVTLPNNYDIEGAFPKVHIRTNTLLNVLWTPVDNGVAMISAGAGAGTNYAKKGNLMHGAPYSEASEYNKYIGQHVSIRTFLTAMLNPRSVVYTEDISINNVSKYEINYTGVYSTSNGVRSLLSGPYYGTVCSGYTAYAQGRSDIRMTSDFVYSDTIVNLLEKYTNYSYGDVNHPYPQVTDGSDIFDKIMPLDLLWYTGHAMLVTDVYTDEFGKNRYIVITEETIPVLRSTVYTREMFKERFVAKVTTTQEDTDQWTIYRYKGWTDDLYETISTQEYEYDNKLVQREFDQYMPLEEATIEDFDIQCFAGDYASFSIGNPDQAIDSLNNNKLYLNIHRGGDSGYTHLQIFNESDTNYNNPIVTLPIASGSDYVSQSNILDEDVQNQEDWIKFDVADYWRINQSATYGKYKARIVRMVGGQIVNRDESSELYVSGFVHFEMVYIGNDTSTKISGTSNNYICSFETNGIPYLIRQEKKNGITWENRIYEIKDSDYTTSDGIKTGNINLNWSKNSTGKYIKLFVRGDYGVVVKRMQLPDQA